MVSTRAHLIADDAAADHARRPAKANAQAQEVSARLHARATEVRRDGEAMTRARTGVVGALERAAPACASVQSSAQKRACNTNARRAGGRAFSSA